MTAIVTIVDYGVGNLFSVCGALEYCGVETVLATEPDAIENADRLLLPGVGAFGDAMADMRDNSLVEHVLRFVEKGRPLLGICLGMQMLLTESEEFGQHEGLDLIPGGIRAIPPTGSDGRPHCIPHVGWSPLEPHENGEWKSTILDDIDHGTEVYFVHSFSAQPENPKHRLAVCDYNGHTVTAVVQADNVIGCQFHPEKSGKKGLSIIRNFLSL